MLVRRIARPMFAAGFVSQGIEAFRNPDPHVARTEAAWQELGPRLGLPPAPGAGPLRLMVRAHGAATTVAAVMLALGRVPRMSALTLAALTVPLAVVNQPFGSTARLVATAGEGAESTGDTGHRSRFGRPIGATGGVSTASVRAGGADRAALRERFVGNLSMIGGALIAAIDTEGRPGIAWRARHARVDRATARGAKLALASAAKDARAAVREARRSAG